MSNIFSQDPVYITVTEVRDSTSDSDIQSLNDEKIKILIYRAEKEIDNYIWHTIYKPFSTSQTFLFPVNNPEDDTSLLPADIKEACLYTVEHIFTNSNLSSTGWNIKRETTWPHTIEYVTQNETDNIPDIAQNLLSDRKNPFMSQVI